MKLVVVAIAACIASTALVVTQRKARTRERRRGEDGRATEDDERGAFANASEDDAKRVNATTNANGALKGLKYVIKDTFDVKGRITGFGSPAWATTHEAARRDADVVDALRRAGATAVGITTMDELAYGINGENEHYGTPENPRSPTLIPGGSSSGSAVACAGALRGCDFALGSDTGGSVRVPASYCGVYGIRTSHDVVSKKGMLALAPSFDTVGWFARSINTLQRVGDVLLPEPDSDAPTTPSRYFLLEDALTEKRTTPHAQCAAAAAVMAINEVAPGKLQRMNLTEHLIAGCPTFRSLVKGQVDAGLECLREMVRVLMGAEIWQTLGPWYTKEQPKLGAAVKARIEAASKLGDDEVENYKRIREEVREEIDRILDGGAIFVLPTTPGIAPKRGLSDSATESWRKKCFELLCIATLCGLPQVSIPLDAPKSAGTQGLSLIGGYQMDKMVMVAAREILSNVVEAYPDILEAELLRLNPPEVPGDAEKTKGNEAFNKGDFQGAVEYYSIAVGKNPKSAVFIANRAMAHLKLGNYELAEDDCSKAINLDSKYVKAYLRRGAARAVAGNYLESLMDYEDALRMEPNNSDAKREVNRMKRIIGMADQGMDEDEM